MRNPVVAGQFYPANAQALEEEIKRCFEHPKGPGDLPVKKRSGKVLGAIVPHAGYMYSGPAAAWVYKEIAEAEMPDVFIILGVNHTGRGKSSTMIEHWSTPLGLARVDVDFARFLSEKTGIPIDNASHMLEHSIEVQLPFLQFIYSSDSEALRFVPITISKELNIRKFSLDLKEAIMDSGKSVCIIASSDFTHYGPAYGFLPFTLEKEKKLYEMDAEAIKFIKDQNMKGLLDYIATTGATICGYLGISVLISTLPKSKVQCLQYYTSGDIEKNYKNAVGYAAITFK